VNKHLDLSDDQTFANGFPHEFFTWLRENHPVYWHEPTNITPDSEGFWVMSLYDDVNTIMMDAKTFSSDKAGNRTGGGTAIKDEASAGKVLNQTDDPLHRRLRELANKGFTVKTIGSLEDELRTRTKRLLNSIKVGEEFDFARRIAREIPTQAICIVLGVPEDDRIHLCELIDKGVEVNSGSVIAAEYLRKVHRYAQALIEKKRAQPGDDIFSKIVHAEFEADGSTLSDFELRSFFALLFPAGAETTTRSISGGMLAFIEHPEQWLRLRDERELIKPSVEEIVRWTTPSVYKRRTATRAVDFRDKTIRPGDKVTVWEMSANRDERVFESPFEFNIARSPNRHLGFGAGVHFCLGAALARLELNIVFDEILLSELNFKPAGTVEWMPNNRLVGVKTMPVRVASRN
tara:strand:+ start:247 stop:1458 length:1212 start_codon:yes stop_codon:yes gene_type:complete